METVLEFFNNLIDPAWIVRHGGLYIVALIIFVETGLFFGFFLPGDSLLFIAGMIIANTLTPFSYPVVNLVFWVGLITAGGIVGNFIGYWVGSKSDRFLFRKDNWLFKRKYLLEAKAFYEKKGGVAIIVARFLPVLRTFAPIVAGMVKMDRAKFSFYNIVGSLLWVSSIVSAGFLLGENLWVKNNLEKIVLAILFITASPILFKFIFRKNKKQAQQKMLVTLTGKELRKQEMANT